MTDLDIEHDIATHFKMTGQVWRSLFTEAAKKTIVTLPKMQRCKTQLEYIFHKKDMSYELHKCEERKPKEVFTFLDPPDC